LSHCASPGFRLLKYWWSCLHPLFSFPHWVFHTCVSTSPVCWQCPRNPTPPTLLFGSVFPTDPSFSRLCPNLSEETHHPPSTTHPPTSTSSHIQPHPALACSLLPSLLPFLGPESTDSSHFPRIGPSGPANPFSTLELQ
jgi:hypothetical protein